jgi:hypothetical protein
MHEKQESKLEKIQTGESSRARFWMAGLRARIALDSWDVKEQDWMAGRD